MTTEDTPTEQTGTKFGSPPDLVHTADWFTAPDSTLQRIVDLTDKADHAILTVSLVVPGAVITGTIAPEDRFYDWIIERQMQGSEEYDDEVSELTRNVMDLLFGKHASDLKELRESDEPRHPEMLRYIHLQDAQVKIGRNITDVGFIRVLLSQVSSWTI